MAVLYANIVYLHTVHVDLVIFACLDVHEFAVLRLFTKSRISELSVSMIGSAHKNIFCEIFKFVNVPSFENEDFAILPDLQY